MARKPQQPNLSLSELQERIGPRKLAKRLGITERTLKRWVKKGPSKRYVEAVRRVLVRSEGGLKAAETRVRVSQYRESFPKLPRNELPESQVIPRRAPDEAPEVRSIRKARDVSNREIPYSTLQYEGFRKWYDVNKLVQYVDLQSIIDAALFTMENRPLDWIYVNFLFYRYVPIDPTYQDSFLLANQGKWIEDLTKTGLARDTNKIAESIENVFNGYWKAGQNGKLTEVKGYFERAEKRAIYLGSYQLVVIHSKKR